MGYNALYNTPYQILVDLLFVESIEKEQLSLPSSRRSALPNLSKKEQLSLQSSCRSTRCRIRRKTRIILTEFAESVDKEQLALPSSHRSALPNLSKKNNYPYRVLVDLLVAESVEKGTAIITDKNN